MLKLHPINQMDHIWWSHRLEVRTPGFHPGNRGSIPLGITKCGPFFGIKKPSRGVHLNNKPGEGF